MANRVSHSQTVFNVGDTVGVHYRLIEKEKVSGKTKREVKEEVRERIQIFEGIVIKITGTGNNRSFTVRRIGDAGVGIERIFPLSSPWIKKVTVKKKGNVRRAKLYYLRELTKKETERLKQKEMPEDESPAPVTKAEVKKDEVRA